MKFMVQWELHPERRADVFEVFADMELADYQAMAGPDVTTIGRWHDIANGRGVAIFETAHPDALSVLLMKWNEAVDFEISIVHDDAEAHALIRDHVGSDD